MDCVDLFYEHPEVSWCEDQINDSDIKYIRADTASSKREWVGLTDEDLSVCDEDGVLLARYWEAKLKEKNA